MVLRETDRKDSYSNDRVASGGPRGKVPPARGPEGAAYWESLKRTVCLLSSSSSSCSGNRDRYSPTWGLSIRFPSRSWKYLNATLGVRTACGRKSARLRPPPRRQNARNRRRHESSHHPEGAVAKETFVLLQRNRHGCFPSGLPVQRERNQSSCSRRPSPARRAAPPAPPLTC